MANEKGTASTKLEQQCIHGVFLYNLPPPRLRPWRPRTWATAGLVEVNLAPQESSNVHTCRRFAWKRTASRMESTRTDICTLPHPRRERRPETTNNWPPERSVHPHAD